MNVKKLGGGFLRSYWMTFVICKQIDGCSYLINKRYNILCLLSYLFTIFFMYEM